jgi:hypothetical protein
MSRLSQPFAPNYLPGEDVSRGNPLAALKSANAVPPFLSRLFAQAQGDQTQGTNVNQQAHLPPDVPLMSSMAWAQLSPSEQQGFLSYVSSYGVSPDDYLAMVQAASPQGGSSRYPLFGNRYLRGER